MQCEQLGIFFGHVSKCFIVRLQPPSRGFRPRDSPSDKVAYKSSLFKCSAVIDTVINIHLPDEMKQNTFPIVEKGPPGRDIDRDAFLLYMCCRFGEPPPTQ